MSDFADKSFDMIEGLQKQIAELERQVRISNRALAMCTDECNELYEKYDKKINALTAERKRREECEAVLREVAGAPNRIAENARIITAYFGEGN